MPVGQPQQTEKVGECRACRSFCDKLVDPSGCIEMGCRYLYSYEEISTGRRFVGCVNKVFGAEIDLDMLILSRSTQGGFGGIKMTGQPLPHCQFTVERAYEGEGPAYECVNPKFFDCADTSAEAIRAFDLRKTIAE